MKSAMLFIGLLFAWSCQSGPSTFPWSEKPYSDVLSQAGDKIVLVNYYTDW
ncbi:MAG: hypothetical protein GXO92_02755 [FCB group bacterium]|nr:hypothetical protein [FCB group bacterium]